MYESLMTAGNTVWVIHHPGKKDKYINRLGHYSTASVFIDFGSEGEKGKEREREEDFKS